MISHRNTNSMGHILTIEDPIEFIHEDALCLVNQREIGIDSLTYAEALRAAMRESPDVVMIGEIRDLGYYGSSVRIVQHRSFSSFNFALK